MVSQTLSVYLHAHTACIWPDRDYTVCTSAARAGSIACLRYAHQNGCTWDGTCIAAAENGMLECLMFAHENGCLMFTTCSRAREHTWGNRHGPTALRSNKSIRSMDIRSHGHRWAHRLCHAWLPPRKFSDPKHIHSRVHTSDTAACYSRRPCDTWLRSKGNRSRERRSSSWSCRSWQLPHM